MNKTILVLLLTAALPAPALSAGPNSPYASWCKNSASAEKLSDADRERHVAECIEALEEADRNPDKGKKRDEEG